MPQERFKMTPAVYLILIKDSKILLSRRYKTGYFDNYYSFPAGHLESEETLMEAVVRETKEEIGIDLNIADLKLVHVMNRKIIGNERIDFFFTVAKWQGEPRIMETNKCNDLNWFEINNLPDNIIPYIKQVINCVTKNINYSEREGPENEPLIK